MIRIFFILFILFNAKSSYAVDVANNFYCSNPVCEEAPNWTAGTANDNAFAWCDWNNGQANGSSVLSFSSATHRQYNCLSGGGGIRYSFTTSASDACPAGASGFPCQCTPPNTPTNHNQACNVVAPPCPAEGTVIETGYYDVGTSPIAMPVSRACDGGCASIYVGSGPEYSSIVDGVKHYYAKGGYESKGVSCSTGTAPTSMYETPQSNTCGPDQSSVTMGGKTKCIDSSGNPVNTNSASSIAAAQSAQDAANASAVAAAQNIAAANGASASSVADAGSVAAGILGAGGGAGGFGTGSNIKDPVMRSFCQDNPTSKLCADEELGTVEDSELQDKEVSVAINPVSIGSAGACPAPSPMVIRGHTYYFDWTTYCNFATGIKPILLVFAWLSAAGILIGGFKE